MDSELTLEKAKTMVRQGEAVRDQKKFLKSGTADPSPVEAVSGTSYHQKSKRSSKPDRLKKCVQCGKAPTHSRDNCPATDAKCHRCCKIGHFGAVCLTRPMDALVENDASHDHSEFTQDSSALDSFFLDTVEDSLNSKYWNATIDVNGFI